MKKRWSLQPSLIYYILRLYVIYMWLNVTLNVFLWVENTSLVFDRNTSRAMSGEGSDNALFPNTPYSQIRHIPKVGFVDLSK